MPKNESGEQAPVRVGNKNRLVTRRVLLLLFGPVVVAVVSLYLYYTGGRVVTTDNAYVQADKVAISAEVSGPIVKIWVQENQAVQQGDILFEIDSADYQANVQKSEANLRDVLTDINSLKAQYKQNINEIELARIDIGLAQKEYSRMKTLEVVKAVPTADLDTARHKLDAEMLNLKIIRNSADQILSKLEGNPDIDAHDVARARFAQAELDDALLQLKKTKVKAPFDGVVSRLPKIGQHIDPGASVMSLIADKNFWIVANIKETKLAHVKPGQAVSITTDVYPDKRWSGTVDSINPGSGAEYSIIPAQNATGNWVKVVQRIPVRITLSGEDRKFPLRSGMSATVSVDTQQRRPLPGFIRKALALLETADQAHAEEAVK